MDFEPPRAWRRSKRPRYQSAQAEEITWECADARLHPEQEQRRASAARTKAASMMSVSHLCQVLQDLSKILTK